MPTPATENDGPRFDVLYPGVLRDQVVRRNAAPDDIALALFNGSVRRSFAGGIMTISQMSIREGEWITKNRITGLFEKASPVHALSWPVWQDPGAGRTDAADGGMSFLQGVWTAVTNVIDDGFLSSGIGGLSPQDELKVGLMPAGHPYEGLNGLVPIDAYETGDFFVVAHVEEVLADGIAVIGNQNAHYPKTVTQVLTTLAPTTPAPTT